MELGSAKLGIDNVLEVMVTPPVEGRAIGVPHTVMLQPSRQSVVPPMIYSFGPVYWAGIVIGTGSPLMVCEFTITDPACATGVKATPPTNTGVTAGGIPAVIGVAVKSPTAIGLYVLRGGGMKLRTGVYVSDPAMISGVLNCSAGRTAGKKLTLS